MLLKKNKEINASKYADLMGTAGTIGLHLVSHTAVGAGLGYWLDDWLGTKPWLFITFLVFGIVAGFRAVYLDTMKLTRQQDTDKDAKRNKPEDR